MTEENRANTLCMATVLLGVCMTLHSPDDPHIGLTVAFIGWAAAAIRAVASWSGSP